VSFERRFKIVPEEGVKSELVIERLDLLMTELSSTLRASKYIIGHIKGYVTFDHGGAMGLSIVKDKVNRKGVVYDPDIVTKGFKLALTNIVFRVDEDDLRRLVELGLNVVLPKNLAIVDEAPPEEAS
jgi:hypothetical protein